MLSHREWEKIIPTTGNEYEEHKEAKRRVAQTMIDLGFVNVELEKPLSFENKPFKVDCYGEYQTGIKLAVEILGKKGHNSKYAYHRDKNRKLNLQEKYKLKLISLPAANLGRDMPDEIVRAELLEAVMK